MRLTNMSRFFVAALIGSFGLLSAKSWTVMVFLNGDNNLEGAGIEDFNEMEAAVDTSLYDVYVLFDRISGYDNSNGNWTDTRLYRVLPDPDPNTINSELIKDCGELNMGDPATIVWFVDTVLQMTNSDHYWLIIWNHGSGWDKGRGGTKGVSYDDTDGDNISVAGGELRWALDSIFTLLGRNIDLVSYDACLMGLLEVEYETKDFADVTVHSQETEPGDGYPYDDILNWLNANPDASPQELAHNVARLYVESYNPGGSQYSQTDATQSGVDMGPWYTRYYLAVDDFARELIKAGGLGNNTISSIYQNAQRYYDSDFMDIYHFAEGIANASGLPSELKLAAQRLVDLQGDGSSWIDTALVGSFWYDEDDYWGGDVSNSHGISVYAPTGSASGSYSGLYWSSNSAWYWFIQGEGSLPSEPLITYDHNSLGDSIPSGRVSFKVSVRNSGGADASAVSGTVYTQDPYVTVLQGNLTFGSVSSEGVAEAAESLVVQVSSSIPQGHRVTFFMDLTASGGYSNTTSWNMIATARQVLVREEPRREPVMLARSLGRGVELVFDPAGRGRLVAYDGSGRLVAVIWNGEAREAVRLVWQPPKPGVYFVRLEGRRAITRRVASF